MNDRLGVLQRSRMNCSDVYYYLGILDVSSNEARLEGLEQQVDSLVINHIHEWNRHRITG